MSTTAAAATPHRRLSRHHPHRHLGLSGGNVAADVPHAAATASATPRAVAASACPDMAEAAFAGHFAELEVSFRTLAANVDRLRALGDALSQFNASFGALLSGLRLANTAVQFPEAPTAESIERVNSKSQFRKLAGNSTEPGRMPHQASCTSSVIVSGSQQQAAVRPQPLAANLSLLNTCREPCAEPAPPPRQPKPVVKVPPGTKTAPTPKTKKSSFVKKITGALPLKLRDNQHRPVIESIVRALSDAPDGLYMQDIDKLTGSRVPKTRCTEYMNALVHSKHVVKVNQKGLVFRLDPVMYPLPRAK